MDRYQVLDITQNLFQLLLGEELLMNLLNCPPTLTDNILNCNLYEWRKFDDKLYGFLSRKIKETLDDN